MEKEHFFIKDSAKRQNQTLMTVSANTNPNPQVDVVSLKSDKKEKSRDKRTNFSKAKKSAYELYERLKWILPSIKVTEPAPNKNSLPYKKPLTQEEELFKVCLLHVLEEMKDYNERAFKKDLVQKMSTLISDRRFVRSCKVGEFSMFMLSQEIAWCLKPTYDEICQKGIANVSGFAHYGLPCYRFEDLMPDFKILGYEESEFNGDPYCPEGKEERSNGAKPNEE